MYVSNYFNLEERYVDKLHEMTPEFGYDGYGEIVYYRTYSRKRPKDNIEAELDRDSWTGQEGWHDTVLRVVNGTFTIRKDHYLKNHIPWDETHWQNYANRFAKSMFLMEWIPPGRGLWAMGTDFIYQRGSMALYNCAFTNLTSDKLAEDLEWLMDSLMVGCGVGWYAQTVHMETHSPVGTYQHIIGDNREAWARSVRILVEAYTCPRRRMPIFDYSPIRAKGLPIRGFGGLASGPEPLKKLHKQIVSVFSLFLQSKINLIQLKSDLANMIGCCVVAGNVRRSAEIGLGWIDDATFRDLKDYTKFPERAEYGWMSNNTVMCEQDHHFELLGEVAKRVVNKGEPGIANLRNFKEGRLNGKKHFRRDEARGANPCGEITLEHRETCNVVETCPTNCSTVEIWYRACEFATFYASTVSLLPTHQPTTNAVVMRNRRIGVGIIDYTGWVTSVGQHNVIRHLRKGYKIVESTNRQMNAEAGIPEAIKKTTIKPGGTVPKLVGKTPGAGFATFDYTIRRTRIASNSPLVTLLREAGIPMEPEVNHPEETLVFEYPIYQSGRTAEQVSIWEQALNIVTLQREWSDNAVSNTIYFKPKWKLIVDEWTEEEIWGTIQDYGWSYDEVCCSTETVMFKDHKKLIVSANGERIVGVKIYKFNPNHEEDMIEPVLSSIMPLIKMVSFLPHTIDGVYKQMPESGTTEADYLDRRAAIDRIDWSRFSGSDGDESEDKYCSGGICVIPR